MPRSQAEVRLAHSVLGGDAQDSGMSPDYAKEVVGQMHGKKMSSLPDHSSPPQKPKGKRYQLGKKARKP